MATVMVTPPAVEPVLLADAKAHLNITDSGDDTLISAQILASRQLLERMLGQSLITTTFDLFLDAFPSGRWSLTRESSLIIDVPGGPLQSVTSVNYMPGDGGAETVMASTGYNVDAASVPGRIEPGTAGWPITAKRINAVRIRYVAGYGDAAANVPDALKRAILLLVGHMHENREAVAVGVSTALLPMGVSEILSEYRNWSM